MKLFVAGLSTETNAFLPIPTAYADFESTTLVYAGDPDALQGFLNFLDEKTRKRGWTLVDGLFAEAQPSGKTQRVAYEALRDEILGRLRAAMPVHVVFLGLHGAMVAAGYDDCEGDLLERVREIVGRDVPPKRRDILQVR